MKKAEFEGEIMGKPDLIDAVRGITGDTKKATAEALTACFQVIGEQLGLGNRVQIVGHGTYQTAERAGRVGRNPQTKEPIQISAKRVPVFKAGKKLKDFVNI